jgi:hypothetical protein
LPLGRGKLSQECLIGGDGRGFLFAHAIDVSVEPAERLQRGFQSNR